MLKWPTGAGATATRAGTSSARRWRCATSARGSTSTPAASTTSSRTTRTRSPSRRRSSAGRRRHWVHGEFLLMAGQKMAKSAGNFQRVTGAGASVGSTRSFRYLADLALRHKLEYSDASIWRPAAPRVAAVRRCRRSDPPAAVGPWAGAADRGRRSGDRPSGDRRGIAGHGGGGPPTSARPGARPDRRCPEPVVASTSGSWRPSTTISTCHWRWRPCAKRSGRSAG